MRSRLVIVLVLVQGCTAIRAELRERTDALLMDYRGRSSSEVFVAVDAGEWEPGEYAVYVSEREGEPALVRFAVDSVTKGSARLRVQYLGYRGRGTYWLHYRLESARVLERITVQPDSGPEYQVDAAAMESEVPVWLAIPLQRAGGKKTVQTPAGKFEDCFAVTGRTPLEGAPMSGLAHGAVPVLGVVEASSADGMISLRLVELGNDGGGSLF